MTFAGPFSLLGEQNLGLKNTLNSLKTLTSKQYLSFALMAASHWLRKIYPLAIQPHHVKPQLLNLPASFDKHNKRRLPRAPKIMRKTKHEATFWT